MPHPICTGGGDQNGDHCCFLGENADGSQRVCEFLSIDDPRVPDRHYACGVFLEIKDRFKNQTDEQIWNRVLSDTRYIERIGTFLENRGLDHCNIWRGQRLVDGGCKGQCCFLGWEWDANDNVTKQP